MDSLSKTINVYDFFTCFGSLQIGNLNGIQIVGRYVL